MSQDPNDQTDKLTITVRNNGPLLINPEDAQQVVLVDHEGNRIEWNKPGKNMTLCRCGASSNKPFCDGTHSKIGFQGAQAASAAEAGAPPAPPAPPTGGG